MGKSSTSTYICQNRHGTYYARLVIPKPLQNQFNNKREVRRSLQTDSKRLAIRRARVYRVRFDILIDALMSEHDDTAERSPQADIDALKGQFGAIQATFEGQHTVTLPGGKKTTITAKIERNLASMDETDRHKEHLLRQLREEARREQETAEMVQHERRTEELHQAQLAAITAAAILAPSHPSIQPTGKTVSEYLDEYIDYKMTPGRKKSWGEGTARQKPNKLNVFRSIFGDKPTAALSRDDMESYIKVAYSIPANFSNSDHAEKFKDITLDMILNDSPKLKSFEYKVRGAGTVKEDLKNIKAFLKWVSEKKDINLQSPMNALSNEIGEIDYDSEKRAFTQEELKLLFEHNPASENYINGFSKPVRFWVPMIALYTGMRLAEICQLHLSDIKRVKALSDSSTHWVFDVNEENGNQLKCGKLNVRKIPIHKNVISAGFLDYVDDLNAKGETKLFPGVVRDSSNQFGTQSQWFGIYSSKAGVTDTKTSFHSFRHSFCGHLSDRHTPEDIVIALSGHQFKSLAKSTYNRSRNLDIKPLADAIDSIDYGLTHPKWNNF
jgi:integrase